MADTQSRKWILTFNNPEKHGFTHDKIKSTLANMKPVTYWCMADEQGQTYHTHLYMHCATPVRFSTMGNYFPKVDREMARGTAQENRDYITKSGKWEKDDKHGTKIEGTFEEWGIMPIERQGARTDLAELHDLILDGHTNCAIYEQNPDFIKYHTLIEQVRQDHRYEAHRGVIRQLEVMYIWGATGVGKTRGVLEKHCMHDIYRITDYSHPFDAYKGEPVIVFDEFRSQLKISDMLNYLDIYPLTLPSRYSNKQACYTRVYILSNEPLKSQYKNIQTEQKETWLAFLRRIHVLAEMTREGYVYQDIHEHVNGYSWDKPTEFREIDTQEELPF